MALKTFNVNPEAYQKFSNFCKSNGFSMSKQINFFIEAQIEEEPKVRKEYLKKLETISKGRFIKVDNFSKRYEL